ncbi:MAG TPA: hypothetical protein VIV11_00645 [Kofleriaceae bacterium]
MTVTPRWTVACMLAACSTGDPPAGKSNEAIEPCTGLPLSDRDRPRVAAIDINFLLARDLTRGVFLGARWVSPPTYTVVARDSDARVQLRARVRDSGRKSMAGLPAWKPLDPSVVSVEPSRGNEVTLRIARPGTTSVTVSCDGVTRVLAVSAVSAADRSLRVVLSRR